MECALSEQDKKVVWILGSGFSQALGGPMLKDLLASRDPAELKVQADILDPLIPAEEKVRCSRIFEQIPLAHKILAAGNEQKLWTDAEQFLDTLESANIERRPDEEPSAGRVRILGLLKAKGFGDFGLRELAKAARHAIAFDCSVFLRAADVNSEKWEPYRDWARTLNGNHTVVTFNYDMVPDLLAACPDSNLRIVGPEKDSLQSALDSAKEKNKACVLKVHGSVAWGRDGDLVFKATGRHGSALPDASLLWRKNEDFAIGIPGPAKKDLVAQALRHLWDEAMTRIKDAEIVIFVGYRFPPSDSMARRDILKAVYDNPYQWLVAMTVLGPNNPDEPRLLSLLETAMNSSASDRRALPKPLYAQDFLSLLPMGCVLEA